MGESRGRAEAAGDSGSHRAVVGMTKSDSTWVGSANLHDAHIRTVARTGAETLVQLTSYDGHEMRVHFSGVTEVAENRPIGMVTRIPAPAHEFRDGCRTT